MLCFGKDCRCVRVNLSLQKQHRSVLPFCLDNHFVLSRVSSFSFTSAGCAESPQNEELAVCRTVLSQNKAHFPGQQLPSMATTAGLLDEAKPNLDGSTQASLHSAGGISQAIPCCPERWKKDFEGFV